MKVNKDFGKSWMSNNARDLFKIAIYFGGFDAKVLALRLAQAPSRGETINTATVERILNEMFHEAQPAKPRLKPKSEIIEGVSARFKFVTKKKETA